jgi:hypothetical protein
MEESDSTSPDAREPGEPEGISLGRFTPADMRLLIITFSGTVVANIVTALLIGAAILVARATGPLPGIQGWGTVGICLAAAGITAAVVISGPKRTSIIFWIEVAILITMGIAALLVLVGMAARLT